MARAGIRTMLPLDRWAYHLGIEPRHFNQLYGDNYFPIEHCRTAWMQYPWQSSDRVSREEVADAIYQAEQDIMTMVGYALVPGWVEEETHRTAYTRDRIQTGGSSLMNTRSLFQSVHADRGHFIAGGIEQKDLIAVKEYLVHWTFQDLDLDGYDETAVIIYDGWTWDDVNEVACYFYDEGGADEWEIRPLKYVNINTTTDRLTIHIDRHLLVRPELQEALTAARIDGEDVTNFVHYIDLYRHWHDGSQQVRLEWERVPGACDCGDANCAACAWQTQWGCIQGRDRRLGVVTYQPGNYDEDSEGYTVAALQVARQPERVRLWYRSGYQSSRVARPLVEMEPFLERMITIYSATLLDRQVCDCSNVQAMIERWTQDLALVLSTTSSSGRYQITDRMMGCPWGTRAGALEAYNRLSVPQWKLTRSVRY